MWHNFKKNMYKEVNVFISFFTWDKKPGLLGCYLMSLQQPSTRADFLALNRTSSDMVFLISKTAGEKPNADYVKLHANSKKKVLVLSSYVIWWDEAEVNWCKKHNIHQLSKNLQFKMNHPIHFRMNHWQHKNVFWKCSVSSHCRNHEGTSASPELFGSHFHFQRYNLNPHITEMYFFFFSFMWQTLSFSTIFKNPDALCSHRAILHWNQLCDSQIFLYGNYFHV